MLSCKSTQLPYEPQKNKIMFNNFPKNAVDNSIIYLIQKLLSYKKMRDRIGPIYQDMLMILIENPVRWRIIISQKYGIAMPNVPSRVGEAITHLVFGLETMLGKGMGEKTALKQPPFVIDARRKDRRARAIQIGNPLSEEISWSDTRTKCQLQNMAVLVGIEHYNFTCAQVVTIPMSKWRQYYSESIINKIDTVLQKKNVCLGMSQGTVDAYIAFAKKWQ